MKLRDAALATMLFAAPAAANAQDVPRKAEVVDAIDVIRAKIGDGPVCITVHQGIITAARFNNTPEFPNQLQVVQLTSPGESSPEQLQFWIDYGTNGPNGNPNIAATVGPDGETVSSLDQNDFGSDDPEIKAAAGESRDQFRLAVMELRDCGKVDPGYEIQTEQ